MPKGDEQGVEGRAPLLHIRKEKGRVFIDLGFAGRGYAEGGGLGLLKLLGELELGWDMRKRRRGTGQRGRAELRHRHSSPFLPAHQAKAKELLLTF